VITLGLLDTRRLLGRGWSLPLAPDRAGRLPWADGPEKVRQAILILLETEPGERVMRPDFGCGLRRFLMQPRNTAIRAQIQREVIRALTAWEGRIRLETVAVEPGDDPSLVLVEIAYVHVLDGRRDTLVYPFYLE
jgi:phage baseplate assembly protein W